MYASKSKAVIPGTTFRFKQEGRVVVIKTICFSYIGGAWSPSFLLEVTGTGAGPREYKTILINTL